MGSDSRALASLARLSADRSIGATCHAIRVRLHGAAIATAAAAVGRWCESVPFASDAPAAMARRAAELARPVERGGARPGWRAVLLRYEDDAADLMVVAQRAALDRNALVEAARALARGQSVPAATAAADATTATATSGEAEDAAVLADWGALAASTHDEWALGGAAPGDGCGEHTGAPLPRDCDGDELAAALAFVLARCDGEERALVARLVDDGSGGEGVALVSVDCPGAIDSRALVAAVQARATTWLTPAAAGALGGAEPAIGLWGARTPPEGASEYRPCLAPPFALTVEQTRDAAGAPRLVYSFERARFAPAIVAALDGALTTVLRAFVAEPAPRLSAVPLVDGDEAARLIALGRGSALRHEPERIERTVAALAHACPDAPALSFEGERLTYAELDARANQAAHALSQLGVRAGDRVGVCLERSLDLVPTLLAVLKAGAAYVPMDPAYPTERLAFMSEDAGLSVVISERADFPRGAALSVIGPEELRARAAAAPRSAPTHGGGSDDAAYVIYTSGSTGRPKGVVIPHRNVSALIAATRDDFALGARDTWTLFHSTAFDFSVWEIWGCLTTGGHLVVVPYWVSRSPDDFLELLARERVTVLNQTPSAFAQLADADRRRPAGLAVRLVIFGGEGLDTRMLLRWFDRHPESACRLVNMYGITETTVHVTAETITRRHALAGSRSVGCAMAGWSCRVLDPEGRLLPPGVPGEIYVGGAGVALHYLNRPELTAARFLVDGAGERIYRSGDKGRLGFDGKLEHLGRLDGQVKIRGFRIELDEIRAVLLEHPSVTAAAVVLSRGSDGDAAAARLDAYVVLASGSGAEVRAHAARVLPDYMTPATVTALPALPLTTNGKLDVKRLPPPAPSTAARAPIAPPVAASANALEERLRRIFSDVMGVEVALDDNFFDVGGNSLYAVRIGVVVREHQLPVLPLRELYRRQTVRRVAAFLAEQVPAATPEVA
jgi:amino acid adenylation domain-containing protein